MKSKLRMAEAFHGPAHVGEDPLALAACDLARDAWILLPKRWLFAPGDSSK